MPGIAWVDRVAYVYMMASRQNGTIYLGSTPDLPRRVWEHRNLVVPGFTKRYRCTLLVWYEQHPDILSARHREKQMKEWRRKWKLEAIEAMNPKWNDLYEQIIHG